MYLVVDVSDILAAVLVDEVERVAGEDDLLARPEAALHEEGVGVACMSHCYSIFLVCMYVPSNVSISHLSPCLSLSARSGFDVRVTSQMRSLLRFSYEVDILACELDVVSSMRSWSLFLGGVSGCVSWRILIGAILTFPRSTSVRQKSIASNTSSSTTQNEQTQWLGWHYQKRARYGDGEAEKPGGNRG